MGTRLDNWLSKASTPRTQSLWNNRWKRFANWVVSEMNPLTGTPYLDCHIDEVDDVIRSDFETMPSHLFHDRYRDLLTKYVTSFRNASSNTVASYVSSVRSFFTNEATSIRLQKGKIPRPEMAMNEHRFTLEELHRIWMVADTEGKARLSVAVSLGWGIGDFMDLERLFIEQVLNNVDEDGFTCFDTRRKKTKARVRGILNPCAVHDLLTYLPRIPTQQHRLWSIQTHEGCNVWLKTLVKEAGIQENGSIRFHLLRKYVFNIVSSQCGPYEAKLLVGKTIPLSDATYNHGLEDRLLARYKEFAAPFLTLDASTEQGFDVSQVEEHVQDLDTTIQALARQAQRQETENLELKSRLAKFELEKQRDLTALKGELDEQRQLIQNLKQALVNMERVVRHSISS